MEAVSGAPGRIEEGPGRRGDRTVAERVLDFPVEDVERLVAVAVYVHGELEPGGELSLEDLERASGVLPNGPEGDSHSQRLMGFALACERDEPAHPYFPPLVCMPTRPPRDAVW